MDVGPSLGQGLAEDAFDLEVVGPTAWAEDEDARPTLHGGAGRSEGPGFALLGGDGQRAEPEVEALGGVLVEALAVRQGHVDRLGGVGRTSDR